jgi:hypothetical protein
LLNSKKSPRHPHLSVIGTASSSYSHILHHQRIADFLLLSSPHLQKSPVLPRSFASPLVPRHLTICNHDTITRCAVHLLAPRPHLRHRAMELRTEFRCPGRTAGTPICGPTTPFSGQARRNRYCWPRERRDTGPVLRQHHHRHPAPELPGADRYRQF